MNSSPVITYTAVTRCSLVSCSLLEDTLAGDTGVLLRNSRHFQRARKQNVVFEMNVLVQVALEFLQALIQRPECGTGVGGRLKPASEGTDGRKQLPGILVLRH